MQLTNMKDSIRREMETIFNDYLPVHILLKPIEVEKTYGVKRETVRKWHYRGHLQGFRMKGGIRFRRVDVEQIIGERMPHLLEQFKERSNKAKPVS